jgi:hypothetical protein
MSWNNIPIYTTFVNSQSTRAHIAFVNNQGIRVANAFANIEGIRGGTRVAIVSFVNLFKAMKLLLTSNNQPLMLLIFLKTFTTFRFGNTKVKQKCNIFFLIVKSINKTNKEIGYHEKDECYSTSNWITYKESEDAHWKEKIKTIINKGGKRVVIIVTQL